MLLSTPPHQAKKVSTRFDFLFPGPDLSDRAFCNGMSFAQILQLWGFYEFESRLPANVPCILVTEPLAHLVQCGMWFHLGCRPSRAFSKPERRHPLAGEPDSLSKLKALFRQASSCPSIFQPGASACHLVMSGVESAHVLDANSAYESLFVVLVVQSLYLAKLSMHLSTCLLICSAS